jgi:hypothetical protein
MVLHADRSGYFYVLDRLTGEHLLTSKFSEGANWAKGINEKGQPIRDVEKDSTVPGSLVSPNNGGATNWPPPAYSPDTGLMYVPTNDAFAMYYLTETDPRGAMGLGGKEEDGLGSLGSYLTAIDYKTGKVAWRHRYPGRQVTLRRRRRRQLGSLQPGRRNHTLAHPSGPDIERPRNIHVRRPPTNLSSSRRHPICLHPLLNQCGTGLTRYSDVTGQSCPG